MNKKGFGEVGMKHQETVNAILVDLFNDIMKLEAKEVITPEFKDITNNDMHIIEAVGVKAARNMSSIAKDLKITVGTLTTAINSLVKKGYVCRKRGEQDRRVVFISLSEKGKRAYYHHERFHQQMIAHMLERLTDEEIVTTVKALDKLRQYFKSLE